MSPQRVADAARVFPYTYSQGPTSGPEGSAQDQRGKAKKVKGRPKERNSRPEEDGLDIEPPFPRNLANTSRGGARRSYRGGRKGAYEDVPNYPPPSFQEAILTPPMSVCSSASFTFIHTVPPSPIEVASEPTMYRQPAASTSRQLIAQQANEEIGWDSDDSLEIIDDDDVFLPSGNELEQRVQDDWRHRRGVEFPSPPSLRPENGNLATISSLGRAAIRNSPSALEAEVEETSEVQLHRNPSSSPKRRLTLSPLRTLFPTRPHNAEDRSLSAHPSPSTSPYGSSLSTAFFRSTTSLASSSLMKFPLTTGSITGKGDGFMLRKLFSHKGKEKEKLDSWEILSEGQSQPPRQQTRPEGRSQLPRQHMRPELSKFAENPTSLMSAMASIANASTTSMATSPTRCQSFAYGSPTVEAFRAASPSTTMPDSSSDAPTQDESFLSTHPLSLRDVKVASTPFVKRSVRQRSPAPSSPTPTIINAEGAGIDGPPLTSVRTRMTPKIKQTTPVARASSPLSIDPWRVDDVSQSTALFQQALETPLPLTPIHRSLFDYSREGAMTSVFAPIPARPQQGRDLMPFLHSTMSEISTVKAQHPSFNDPMTPTSRRHYAGRPLPRPPVHPRPPIDSTYGSNDGHFNESMGRSNTQCPEGLLIDLDDVSLMTGSSTSGTTTPHTEEGRIRPPAFSTNPTSTDLIDLSPETPRQPESVSLSSSDPSLRSFAGTDLALLASNMTDNQRDGGDYEVSLSGLGWPGVTLNSPQGSPFDFGAHRASEPPTKVWNLASDHMHAERQRQRQYITARAY